MQGANIDSFMKTRVYNAGRSLLRIAYNTILATFPWRGLHPVVITPDVLVKCRAITRKECVVVRWQDKIGCRRFEVRRYVVVFKNAGMSAHSKNRNHGDCREKPSHQGFFLCGISRQSLFIDSISTAVRPARMKIFPSVMRLSTSASVIRRPLTTTQSNLT